MIETVYPNFDILDEVTTSEIVPPRKRWIKDFEGPLPKIAGYPMPPHVDYESDGKYLCIPHVGAYAFSTSTSSFVAAAIMLIFTIVLNFTAEEPLYPGLNIGFVLIIFFFLILGIWRRKKEKFFKKYFIVFNRENGLVYLPPLQAYFFQGEVLYPEVVLPFDDIECYCHTTGGGELRIDTYLVPNLPGEEHNPRVYELLFPFTLMKVKIDGKEYEQIPLSWEFVCSFMDKTRQFPQVSPYIDNVKWFQDNNISLPI